MQHCRGCAGTPEDLAAEGKTILTLRHKSADELERQLRQPSHRRSMPQYAHACSQDMGGQDVRPKANPRKIIHSPGEKSPRLFSCSFPCRCCAKNEECGETERRVFAVSHMSPVLATNRARNAPPPPPASLTCLRKSTKAKHLARNSSVCQSHFPDVVHSSTHAYVARWRAAPRLLNRALVLTQRSHSFNRTQ